MNATFLYGYINYSSERTALTSFAFAINEKTFSAY